MSIKYQTTRKNVGTIDRFLRIVLAACLLYFIDGLDKPAPVFMGILAAVLILTALNGYCLLYVPFQFSTCKKTNADQ